MLDRASVICRAANQESGVAGSHALLPYGNVLGIYGLDPSNLYSYVFVAGPNKSIFRRIIAFAIHSHTSPIQRFCAVSRSLLEWPTLENILVTSGKCSRRPQVTPY
jgi:hypothetical protein